MSKSKRLFKQARAQLKDPCFKDNLPYIVTWQSELEIIAGDAYQWGKVETGGELYGLFTHGVRPVIMFATPPGPNALHEVAHFRQDIDFFRELNRYFWENYSLQYLGSWHNHHYLNMNGPSGGDINSAHSISLRNGYRRMCQFVLTFETNPHPNFYSSNKPVIDEEVPDVENRLNTFRNKIFSKHTDKLRKHFSKNHLINYIRIHSFFYPDSTHGQPNRCSLRVIPGVSPIRKAIINNPSDHKLIKQYRYPMNRIMFDSFQTKQKKNYSESELYIWLNNQILTLPNRILEDLKVTVKEGLLILSIPLEKKAGILFVTYRIETPHKSISVNICQEPKNGNLIDFTKEALCNNPHTTLLSIYRKAARHISERKSILHTTYFTKTGDQSEPKRAETNNAETFHDQKDKINY